MSIGGEKGSASTKTPADFLKSIRGRPVVVKLNSGVDYRGIFTSTSLSPTDKSLHVQFGVVLFLQNRIITFENEIDVERKVLANVEAPAPLHHP